MNQKMLPVNANPGDLVRYKHDKTSMGLVVALLPDRESGDYLLVQWQTRRGASGKSQWCVLPENVEVKGAGRYGWRDVA